MPTSEPIATPRPPTSRQAVEPTIFRADFAFNEDGWPESTDELVSRQIANDQYVLETHKPNWCWSSTLPLPIDQRQDFVIAAEFEKLAGQGWVGLQWGMLDRNNRYVYEMAFQGRSGRSAISQIAAGSVQELLPWTNQPQLSALPNAVNELTLHKSGAQLEFLTNGELIQTMPFVPFFGPEIGFVVCGRTKVAVEALTVTYFPDETMNLADAPSAPLDVTGFPAISSALASTEPVPKATPPPTATAAPAPVMLGKRTALVIGNGGYEKSPLQNPANDANDMANVLQRLGFEVTLKTDVNQRDMESAVHDFTRAIQDGESALFYYSGHGSQVDGDNYLIPVRENILSASDIRYKAVNVNYILGKMEESGNRTNIIILDACRDNPFKGFKSQAQGFAPILAPRGTFIAYATAPGSVALESRQDRNSIYTKHLLNAMQSRGVMIEQVFKEVLRAVEDDTDGAQTPWISSSLRGDFYFNP